MSVYYNDNDPYCAAWLRNLIAARLLPDGEVDERSIEAVTECDLRPFRQCHFFAGIGGFAYAAKLAGWPDDKELWTGGFPCQPFSVAGKQAAQNDDRHLWPHLARLIAQCRPAAFLGENVAGIVPLALDGVLFDLESAGYASRAFVVPACAVDAPHRRDRLWFVAHTDPAERWEVDSLRGRMEGQHTLPQGEETAGGPFADGEGIAEQGSLANTEREGPHASPFSGIHREAQGQRPWDVEPLGHSTARDGRNSTAWSGAKWIAGADGKARRVEPGVRLLADGIPARVAKLRALGNAIVPQVAAEILVGMRAA